MVRRKEAESLGNKAKASSVDEAAMLRIQCHTFLMRLQGSSSKCGQHQPRLPLLSLRCSSRGSVSYPASHIWGLFLERITSRSISRLVSDADWSHVLAT